MAENLFEGLPPPSASLQESQKSPSPVKKDRTQPPPPPPPPALAPAPILKSSLKREKPSEAPEGGATAAAPQKRIRFKTTVDASEQQVIDAMQKIASHIRNPSKFGKASKLALQLIEAGSVKEGTSDYFFAILEAAMSSPNACNDPALRADYQILFSSAQQVADCLTKHQKNQLAVWNLQAVVANDLYTDDSFVFAKVAGRIKEAISSLPDATDDDDKDEATALSKDEVQTVASDCSTQPDQKEESDPFGLDSLLPGKLKKDEKLKGRKDAAGSNRKVEEEETKKFLKLNREALINCVEIAARRYKVPWAQTVVDILAKHAFDNIGKFTSQQRNAIEKLWLSIKEQHTRRKQGKSVTGKLDMNAFEYLQQKYANEKISIRHAVGGSGARRAEQWLG
ncbi:hypothetical protein H6P81_017312 [Aristolochia fimbriata]|uniref:Uncharacterized protein n=1 Tax=Aristolochia fimbriata TaxID=158543 RepID=A0AAV7DY01_ARIFI|nr:hypothetical protein H6P81_017312 [Aristolochia fimbriata]